jgi:hypothetical protein
MDAESLLSLDLSTIRLPQGDEESERTVQHFLYDFPSDFCSSNRFVFHAIIHILFCCVSSREILEEHRRLCVAQGKYAEAEISRIRIDELRRYEEHRRREAMVTYQLAERIAVEESNARELQRFNSAWDRAMTEYDAKTQELVEQMKLRHAQEFQEYQEELRLRYPLRPKFSRDLLNTRRIQQVLAKQNQYAEAHRVKTKADLVEEWEMGQQNKLWLDKLEKLERQFVSKQDTELAALVKRIQSGRVGQMRARQSEYERLLQHYQNIKQELLNQQNVERLKAEKHSAHASNKSTSLQYVPPIEVVPQSPVATRSQRVNALLEASQFHTVGQSPIAKAANAAAEAAYNSLTRTAPPQSARGSAAPVPSATTSGSTSASVSARRPQSAASSRPELSQAQSLSAQTSPKGVLNTSTTSNTSNITHALSTLLARMRRRSLRRAPLCRTHNCRFRWFRHCPTARLVSRR